MKIKSSQLRNIIQEELRQVLFEQESWPESNPDDPAEYMSLPRSGSRENPITLPPETVTRSETAPDVDDYSPDDARADFDASNEAPRESGSERRARTRQHFRGLADRGELNIDRREGESFRGALRRFRSDQPEQYQAALAGRPTTPATAEAEPTRRTPPAASEPAGRPDTPAPPETAERPTTPPTPEAEPPRDETPMDVLDRVMTQTGDLDQANQAMQQRHRELAPRDWSAPAEDASWPIHQQLGGLVPERSPELRGI